VLITAGCIRSCPLSHGNCVLSSRYAVAKRVEKCRVKFVSACGLFALTAGT
jgi:hypothetical protein